MSAVQLAPAAVARVAAFPLARAEALAEPALAAAARDTGPEDMSSGSAYALAYARAVERGRAHLWAATVDDPAFLRALTLANPDFAAAALATDRARRTKAVRHAETSLYRYLARAVARPEPGGLWAGVALARFDDGAGARSTPAPARWAFAPDLGFFAALFAAVVAGPDYRGRGPFKLNPTLRGEPDGGHRFWLPGPGDSLQERRIQPSRAIAAAIAALAAGPTCFDREAARARLAAAGFPAAATPGLVDLLVEQGVLVGGPRFPTRFADAREALALAEAALLERDRGPWRAACEALADQCARLDAAAPDLPAADLAAALATARATLVALADALAVACPPLPRAALRCDLRAPVTITLGQDLRDMLSRTVSEFAGFQAAVGMGGALSPALVDRWLGADGRALAEFAPPPALVVTGDAPTWEGLGAQLGPELAARAAAWADRLARDVDELVAPASPAPRGGAPLGSLLFGLGGALVGGRPVLRGLVRDATPAFARCAALLEPGGGAVTTWLIGQFERVAAATGRDHAELCFAHATPNVLARPRLVPHAVDLWGADPTSLDVRGARIERDPATGAPLCRVPGRARPLAILSPTAAVVPPADHCQHLLLLSSLRTPPQIPRGDRLGFAAELRSGRHAPRVALPEGQVIRTRRTALAGADLRALLDAPAGPARFAAWQRLAAARDWPALVLVHRDGQPPLLVPRDAPLAVEAMSEGAGRCACITVEEFADDAWIRGADDDRFVAELALPFVRDDALADALAAGQRLARVA